MEKGKEERETDGKEGRGKGKRNVKKEGKGKRNTPNASSDEVLKYL